jgi:hypothetical protein
MLVKLINGDWINPSVVVGVRVLVGDKLGPRVVIDTTQNYGHHLLEFDTPEAARVWADGFGQQCNAALPPALVDGNGD